MTGRSVADSSNHGNVTAGKAAADPEEMVAA